MAAQPPDSDARHGRAAPRAARPRRRPSPVTPYEEHRDYVLAVLSRRCNWLDGSDREAAFHDAYAVFLEKERDGRLEPERMHPRQLRAYLTQAALHKALDEGKRAERRRAVPLGDGAFDQPDLAALPDERVARDMDSLPVREIVAELPERRQVIVKLRFYFDRTPEEIQRFLEISERVYRRELERAMRQIADRYQVVLAGQWCETRRSLLLAYVAGIAGPGKVDEARAHIAACPGCARVVAKLRDASRSAAAAIPVPAFLAVPGGPLARISEITSAVRDTVADIAAGAKQQAVHLAARVDSATGHYAGAARPGTVAAAVTSCIVVGGGATYCVVNEVPGPIRRLVTHEERERPEPRPKTEQARRPAPSPPAPAAPAPEQAPRQAPRSEPRPAEPSTPPPATPETEFGPAGVPEDAPAAPPGGGPESPAPAPRPSGPPGEFDP